jgi:hypothetical protein
VRVRVDKAALAPGTFMQGVSRPLYWDYYTFDVGGEFDGISAQLTYDANCTTPVLSLSLRLLAACTRSRPVHTHTHHIQQQQQPGLYLRRNAFPSRVRSDYGPESTVQSGNVISFSGNSSVALPGAYVHSLHARSARCGGGARLTGCTTTSTLPGGVWACGAR